MITQKSKPKASVFRPKVANYEESVVLFITQNAYSKMMHITRKLDDEVGWFGFVKDNGNLQYVLHDIVIPKQQVHGATTEISPEGLEELMGDLLNSNELEKYNEMRLWGHSHVAMGTSPSSQDLKQLDELTSNLDTHYFGLIANQMGEFTVTYLNAVENVKIENVRTELLIESLTDEELEKLDNTLKAKVSKIPLIGGVYGWGARGGSLLTGAKPSYMTQTEWFDMMDNCGYDDYYADDFHGGHTKHVSGVNTSTMGGFSSKDYPHFIQQVFEDKKPLLFDVKDEYIELMSEIEATVVYESLDMKYFNDGTIQQRKKLLEILRKANPTMANHYATLGRQVSTILGEESYTCYNQVTEKYCMLEELVEFEIETCICPNTAIARRPEYKVLYNEFLEEKQEEQLQIMAEAEYTQTQKK